MSELQRSLSEPVFLYSRTKAVSLSVFIGRGRGVQIASTGPCTRGISSVHLARILVILLVFILLFFVHMVASFYSCHGKGLRVARFNSPKQKSMCEERPVVENVCHATGADFRTRISNQDIPRQSELWSTMEPQKLRGSKSNAPLQSCL